jgi:hypothetical protein
MEAKETDDQAMKEKKAKKKQAAQQLAASWQSDFEADIEQGMMPEQFSGMHQRFVMPPCYMTTLRSDQIPVICSSFSATTLYIRWQSCISCMPYDVHLHGSESWLANYLD